MIVYTIQENNEVLGVFDNLLRCYEFLNKHYGYDVLEFRQDFKDIRDSGLECTFSIDSDEYLIKYFLLND